MHVHRITLMHDACRPTFLLLPQACEAFVLGFGGPLQAYRCLGPLLRSFTLASPFPAFIGPTQPFGGPCLASEWPA